MKTDELCLITDTVGATTTEYAKWCLWVLGGVINYENRNLDKFNACHKPCPADYRGKFRSDEEYNALCSVKNNWETFQAIYSVDDAAWLCEKMKEWSDIATQEPPVGTIKKSTSRLHRLNALRDLIKRKMGIL